MGSFFLQKQMQINRNKKVKGYLWHFIADINLYFIIPVQNTG